MKRIVYLYLVAVLFGLGVSLTADASVRVFNYDGADMGNQSELKCETGNSCAIESGQAVMRASGLGSVESASAIALSSAHCGSTYTFEGAAAVEMDLPGASTVVGCKLTFVQLTSSTHLTIDPASTDQILTMTNSVGDSIRTAVRGNVVALQAISSTQWIPVSQSIGVWSDNN